MNKQHVSHQLRQSHRRCSYGNPGTLPSLGGQTPQRQGLWPLLRHRRLSGALIGSSLLLTKKEPHPVRVRLKEYWMGEQQIKQETLALAAPETKSKQARSKHCVGGRFRNIFVRSCNTLFINEALLRVEPTNHRKIAGLRPRCQRRIPGNSLVPHIHIGNTYNTSGQIKRRISNIFP